MIYYMSFILFAIYACKKAQITISYVIRNYDDERNEQNEIFSVYSV